MPEPAANLARNVRHLRELRGLTQAQVSALADIPRATWAHVETGEANPTLTVLVRVAGALGVTVEELIGPPRATGRLVRGEDLPTVQKGGVVIRKVVPEALPHLQLERMTLPPGSRFAGTPHLPGTREYLACERGVVVLHVSGERFEVVAGDVVVFRGDQRHAYDNPGDDEAVAYSLVSVTAG